MIVQNKINVQGGKQIEVIIAQSHISIIQGGFLYKLNNGACTIIPYPTVEVKSSSDANKTRYILPSRLSLSFHGATSLYIYCIESLNNVEQLSSRISSYECFYFMFKSTTPPS